MCLAWINRNPPFTESVLSQKISGFYNQFQDASFLPMAAIIIDSMAQFPQFSYNFHRHETGTGVLSIVMSLNALLKVCATAQMYTFSIM